MSGAQNISANVARKPLLNSPVELMTNFPSTVGALPEWGNLDDNTISYPAIDNANYFYSTTIYFSAADGINLQAGGMIITYQITGP